MRMESRFGNIVRNAHIEDISNKEVAPPTIIVATNPTHFVTEISPDPSFLIQI